MCKPRWTICLAFALVLSVSVVFVYCLRFITDIKVSKTKDGWLCSGPIQYELRHPMTRPIICGEKLIIVERYKKEYYIEKFKIAEVKMSSPRYRYYITALALSNGHTV